MTLDIQSQENKSISKHCPQNLLRLTGFDIMSQSNYEKKLRIFSVTTHIKKC